MTMKIYVYILLLLFILLHLILYTNINWYSWTNKKTIRIARSRYSDGRRISREEKSFIK